MLFGILLFILIILAEKNRWFLDGCLFGFWILSFIEIVVELTMLSKLIK
jgi:hypothetical protein